jgi:hypothetical protein
MYPFLSDYRLSRPLRCPTTNLQKNFNINLLENNQSKPMMAYHIVVTACNNFHDRFKTVLLHKAQLLSW